MLWVAIMRIAVFTEGKNYGVDGHVIHLHGRAMHSTPC